MAFQSLARSFSDSGLLRWWHRISIRRVMHLCLLRVDFCVFKSIWNCVDFTAEGEGMSRSLYHEKRARINLSKTHWKMRIPTSSAHRNMPARLRHHLFLPTRRIILSVNGIIALFHRRLPLPVFQRCVGATAHSTAGHAVDLKWIHL